MNYGQQRQRQILRGFGMDVTEKGGPGSGIRGHRAPKPEKKISWKPVVDKKEEERKRIAQKEREERISAYWESIQEINKHK